MKISKPIQYVIAAGGLLILGLLGWNAYSAYQENNAVTVAPSPVEPKPAKPKAKASPVPVAKASAPDATSKNPTTAFYNAVTKATSAAELTQTAKTKTEWNTVAGNWQQAIAFMKTVPRTNKNHKVAQQKVVEYQKNLTYAQQASANAN